MESKSIFVSKVFWANAVGLAAMIIQGLTGNFIVSPEIQAGALSVINIILRSVTKTAVNWN